MSQAEIDDIPKVNPEYNMRTRKVDENAETPTPAARNEPRFPFAYGESFKDWVNQGFHYNDAKVEENFLSILPFYPESDGIRKASIINTVIDNKKNYIHEFLIENIEKDGTIKDNIKDGKFEEVKDIVIVHGYAASLGLFIFNFGDLSKIPGIRVHAIDLLGFGLSSRPSFPHYNTETIDDIHKTENWFIDSLETWRQKRGIKNFILIGHSFGGYLSSCYALKYHTKENSILNKLILLSPVGVERNKNSLLKNLPNPYFDDNMIAEQNKNNKSIKIERELTQPQPQQIQQMNPKYESINFELNEEETQPLTNGRKLLNYLWAKNFSPFTIVRNSGPFKSKLISAWTSRRFSTLYETNKEHYKYIHDYIYRVFNGKGSGEYAITRTLAVGVLARLPLIDRLPQFIAKNNLPTLLIYGDKDWMNVEAGKEMALETNQLIKQYNNNNNNTGNGNVGNFTWFKVLSNAGHHLYMDNPSQFKNEIFKFIGYKE